MADGTRYTHQPASAPAPAHATTPNTDAPTRAPCHGPQLPVLQQQEPTLAHTLAGAHR